MTVITLYYLHFTKFKIRRSRERKKENKKVDRECNFGLYRSPGDNNSNLIKTKKAIPIIPAKTKKIK